MRTLWDLFLLPPRPLGVVVSWYGHNRIRPEAARVRLMVQQDLPDPFRMLNYA